MSLRIAMTEKRLEALPRPTDKTLIVYDEKIRSLALRWRPSGKPRWYLIQRAGGRVVWAPLGEVCDWPTVTVQTARELALDMLAKVAKGADPAAEKARRRVIAKGGQVPLCEVLKHHTDKMRTRGRAARSIEEIERIAKLAEAAGIKDLADPGVAARAARWLDAMPCGDLTRHRYKVHLIALGKTALRWWPADVLPREPFLALSGQGAQLPVPAYFTPQEAARLASDEAMALEGGALWAFLLYTGCRWREATWARWDRIDLHRSTFLVLPPTESERQAGAAVKRDKARTVSLQPELVEVMRTWREADPEGVWLFEAHWRSQNHRWNVEAFRAHLVALGIPLADSEGRGRKIHSLRHTHAILAVAAGEDSLRLRLSMGHAGEVMAAHYGSAAMRFRGLLHAWDGVWRLRDPAEVARLAPQALGKRRGEGA